MQYNDIYTVTAKGREELRGAVTLLSSSELDLLVRIDGKLTLSLIQRGMDQAALALFDHTLATLIRKGLVEPAETDPFADSLQMHISQFALLEDDSEAEACAASLASNNYYVRIARTRPPVRRLAPGEKYSAILVDDEAPLAKFLSHYLVYEGFDVRIAGSRDEVVAEFRKPPVPDLVLLDVVLPDADGFDILAKIRAHPRLKDVPVIMLTGKSSREAVLKGLARGADGYITKPVETESLLQAVRTVMGLN